MAWKPQNCSYHTRKFTTFRFRKIISQFRLKFCSRVGKEDDSNISNEDTFETLQVRKSKWYPPEGQFAYLDFFIRKSRDDINKLKFNRNTKFSDLSSEEWSALKSPNSQITSDSWPENIKTVVTITENLLLSDSEKSVLSKGLNFVPKSKKPTNFQLSKTLKNSFAAFNWKPFFMTKRMILTSRTKILSKHFRFESLNAFPKRASSHLGSGTKVG